MAKRLVLISVQDSAIKRASLEKTSQAGGSKQCDLGACLCDGKPDKLGGVKVGKFPVDQAKCKKKGTKKKNKQKVDLKVGKQLSTPNWAV